MATLLYAERDSSSLTSVTSNTVIDSSTVCTDEPVISLISWGKLLDGLSFCFPLFLWVSLLFFCLF